MTKDLPDLEWDQRAGRDHRQILGPPPLTPESDAFRREERRIEQGDDPQRANLRPAEPREQRDYLGDEALSAGKGEIGSPFTCAVGDALLHEPQRAEGSEHEENRFEELEYRDRLDEPIAMSVMLSSVSRAHPASNRRF